MITTLLLGITALAVGMAAVKHWKEIVQWLKDIVVNLIQIFSTIAIAATNAAFVFVKMMYEGVAGIIHKLYYEENGQIIERVTTRTLPKSELPDWAKNKIGMQETNITQEVENELKLKL